MATAPEAGSASVAARGRTPVGWVAGLPCWYRAQCDSTNRVLRDAVGDRVPASGTLAVTDHQTKGRGRLDRVWRNEAGHDLAFSVLLRPSLAPGQAHLLSLAAALAVAETLEAYVSAGTPGPAQMEVKWPNDVMLHGGKVCGILLEGAMDGDRLHWVIAGIGVNVNSDTTRLQEIIEREDVGGLAGRARPLSLRDISGAPVARAPLLAYLLVRLTVRWQQVDTVEGRIDLLRALRERDPLFGRPVQVFGAAAGGEGGSIIHGEGAGLGPEGQLLLRTDSGEIVPIYAGDVSLRALDDRL